MLSRELEPEVMDTPEEARDYDAMDHSEVNETFCRDLLALSPEGPVLDVGTGTAQIPIALLRHAPSLRVVGIDLAEHMLVLGRENVVDAGLAHAISLERIDAKATSLGSGSFPTVMSNSIVHHIPEPALVLREMWRLVAPGGLLFVRDLLRPDTLADVEQLVERYAGPPPSTRDERARFEHQRDLFRASLRAALSLEEVRALAAELDASVSQTSDRHWTLTARKGAPPGSS